MAQKFALRARQREVIDDMIKHFDVETTGTSVARPNSQPQWVVLIYDDVGRNTIAPLLKVKDLRDAGVTLHLHISKSRDAVPETPAIYFCAPTAANIAIIAKDIVSELYREYYINFTAQVSRQLLESLADQVVQVQSLAHVKVFDRTLSFIAMSNDLFSLMQPRSFFTLNSPATTDEQMGQFLNNVVLGLSHVLLTMQCVPVIAYSGGGATEELARRCSLSIRDLLKEQMLVPAATQGRPLLLLADRTSDIASALHHPFTYRGLLTDALGMSLNKVSIRDEQGKEKAFEVDPETDAFFRHNAALEFDQIGKNTEEALEAYKREAKALSLDTGGDEADTQHMSKVIAHAPKLAEKKRIVDAHMCLAHEIFRRIQANELDAFHGVEESFIRREQPDKAKFIELLKSAKAESDRRRLFLVAYLCAAGDEAATAELEQHAALLGEAPFPALAYLKKLRAWSSATGAGGQEKSAKSGWDFAQSLAKNIARQLKSAEATQLPLTRLVDALFTDPSPSRQRTLEGLACMDPRTNQPIDIGGVRFSQVIVFVVGGGCIAEYDNLKQYEQANPRKGIIYGCSEMLTGEEMLAQLGDLGK